MAYQTEYIEVSGIELALHSWIPENPDAVIFYIHGKQSHGGWLFETGPELMKRSIAIYVLDRRGSGLSGGLRGDVISKQCLIEDYYSALVKVRERYRVPLILFGQSFGGSILAGLLSSDQFDINFDAAVFCASGLGIHRFMLPENVCDQSIEDSSSLTYQELNIPFDAYSTIPRYLEFMKNDPLSTRRITRRSQLAFLELEKQYSTSNSFLKGVPSVFVQAREDVLVDYRISKETFLMLTAGEGLLLEFPTTAHYFEFSDQKNNLLSWLTHFSTSGGYKNYV